MKAYLRSSQYIDSNHPDIVQMASSLSRGCVNDVVVARTCFEFVRDEIRHSWDYQCNPVTCKASDVLKHKTGYCYAKSHLLAALLRANGIPTGLCYQRLTTVPGGREYCLHGLNAIYLAEFGWYRVDARGNKNGVEAAFLPPVEKLAFSLNDSGERDLPGIWAEPLSQVVDVLTIYDTVEEVYRHLPDVDSLD